MTVDDGYVVRGSLVTVGRKSGLPRSVKLRIICLNDKYYVTALWSKNRHWYRNIANNPAVEILLGTCRIGGVAREISDEALRLRVLTIRRKRPENRPESYLSWALRRCYNVFFREHGSSHRRVFEITPRAALTGKESLTG